MLEIGPGEGALTEHLAGHVSSLMVVEIDPRGAAVIRERFSSLGVVVRQEDILTTDVTACARDAGGSLRVAGNIPYNITSPILFHLIEHRGAVTDATLMVQREVARRLVAIPRTKDYGILAVTSQLYADMEIVFDVSPGAFRPVPRVWSSVIRMRMLPAPRVPLDDETFFRAMIRGIFGKRRKTLRNSLTYFLGGMSPEGSTTIDLGRRPEELSLAELANLSNELHRNSAVPAARRAASVPAHRKPPSP